MPNVTNTKVPVLFKYERSVLSTSEDEVVSDMLSDFEGLGGRGDKGAGFRAVYGSSKEVEIRKLQQQARDLSWTESSLILAPDQTGDRGLDAKLQTPSQVVAKYNQRVLIDPVFRKAHSSDAVLGVDPNTKELIVKDIGKLQEVEVRKWLERGGQGGRMTGIVADLYGPAATPISSEDIASFQRISKSAAGLGVTVAGVDFKKLPQLSGSGKGGTDFSINIKYTSDAGFVGGSPYQGNVDTLRKNAQRPGGQNYELTMDELVKQQAVIDSIFQIGVVNPQSAITDFAKRRRTVPGTISRHAQEQKPDAFAVLRVFRGFAPDSPDPFGDTRKAASGPDGHPSFDILFQTNRFLLEQIGEQDMERTALIETFGDPYLYLFGSRARIWSYGGTLFDTKGLEWLNEWRTAYQRWMKGSSSTKLKARAMLVYEDVAREGVIVTSNIGKSVQTPGMASLSFQMFVIKEHYINGVPDSLQDGVPKKDEPTFTFFSSAPQTNIDEQYSINYVDVTPPVDANGRHTATTPNPKDTPQQAALHVVDSLASIEQDQIEAAIRKNAFEGERLVRPSGSFVLNLSSTSNAVVHKSAQVIADKIFQMEHVPPTQAGGSITLPVQTGVK